LQQGDEAEEGQGHEAEEGQGEEAEEGHSRAEFGDDDDDDDSCPTLDGKDASQWAMVLEMMELYEKLSLDKVKQCSSLTTAIEQYITVKSESLKSNNLCQMEQCTKECHKLSFFCQAHMSQFIASNRGEDRPAIVNAVRTLHEQDAFDFQQRALTITEAYGLGADDVDDEDNYDVDGDDHDKKKSKFIQYEARVCNNDNMDDESENGISVLSLRIGDPHLSDFDYISDFSSLLKGL
jgi:hypothetical protein